jgi:hypothetical protein
MQCPSCQFENMPGVAACGRCGAQLQLSAAALGVYPPRASPWAKRLRRWLPLYRLRAALRHAATGAHRALFPEFEDAGSGRGVLLRMAVPGWPQFFLGHRLRGRLLLFAYLGCLLLALLFLGSQPGNVLLGFALTIHAASIIDILWSASGSWATRLVMAAACFVAVGGLVYFPIIWTATQFAQFRQINMTAGPLVAGDVILYRPSPAAASVGDVVLYEIPRSSIPMTGHQFYLIQGETIDRIVAGPGQSITWKDRQLLVDGQPVAWQPLYPAGIPVNLQFKVPFGYYGILPSTRAATGPGLPPQVLQDLSLVPQTHIRGTILLRTHPWRRWGRIR